MIVFDLHLGRFSILAQHEPDWRTFNVTREVQGEITVDLPYVRIYLTNYKRTVSRSQ